MSPHELLIWVEENWLLSISIGPGVLFIPFYACYLVWTAICFVLIRIETGEWPDIDDL